MNTIAIFCAKYLFIASALIVGIYWLRADRKIKKSLAIFGIITLPLAYMVAKIASHFYYDPRPFVVSGIAPLIQHAADNGFPSDHTLLVAALAAVMTYFDRKWAIWLWIITLAVASARVYVGVHHTLDVSASILISLLSAAVVYLLGKNKLKHDARNQ
ncbi:undecaprenyl-diphosphatase [Candidatus Parcubacteria bacterium]|nr:undecaprenyl-diphosphatase [Candidatus Parcubacteria bacterium]